MKRGFSFFFFFFVYSAVIVGTMHQYPDGSAVSIFGSTASTKPHLTASINFRRSCTLNSIGIPAQIFAVTTVVSFSQYINSSMNLPNFNRPGTTCSDVEVRQNGISFVSGSTAEPPRHIQSIYTVIPD